MQIAYSLFLFSIKLQADYVLYLLKEACNGGNDLLHGLDEADDLSLGVGHLLEGVDSMTQAEYRKAAIDAVKKLSKDVGIPEKLEALKEEDLPFLAESAYADACRPGNPKDTTPAELTELFRKLM